MPERLMESVFCMRQITLEKYRDNKRNIFVSGLKTLKMYSLILLDTHWPLVYAVILVLLEIKTETLFKFIKFNIF